MPVLMLLNIYLFLVHSLLDRKFSVIFFLPWQKRNQRDLTVKSKSEYVLLKIFLHAFKTCKTNFTMLLFKVLLACNVYPQILWEDRRCPTEGLSHGSEISCFLHTTKKKGQKFSKHVWRCITCSRTKGKLLVMVYFLWTFFSPE